MMELNNIKNIEKWKIFEEKFNIQTKGNPFSDVTIEAIFTNGQQEIRTKGFYNGNGEYIIRFMPLVEGKWDYRTISSIEELDKKTGSFICIKASSNNHGRVLLKKDVVKFPTKEDIFHFSYEDGTSYKPFGTTIYAWINQSEKVQEETLETLKKGYFNKVRMCIFPKYYTYNTTDPEMYAFEGNREDGFDFTRFNTKFFENLEKRIAQLDEMGIEVDIILLHPYDNWGFAKMSKEQDINYLNYVVTRLSHFKNIWWSLANEFDLMPQKSIEDWETYARVVMGNDPYGHLRSIHNCVKLYDHTKPWITHVSIQRIDVYKTAEMVTDWREMYLKPIVVDECAYEGNINFGWGNITGEEMVRRFWEGCIRGGYLSHGEVYVDRGPQIWWSHGGKLHGTSQERILFLQKIMKDMPDNATPLVLTPENHESNWDVRCIHKNDEYFLYYFGFFKPLFRTYSLPKGKKYNIELIDTWEMTIKDLGIFEGDIKINLPEKQYMAIRMKIVD